MKSSEFYKNEFPLEPLLPDLDEEEIKRLVVRNDYNYRFEAYIAGYEAAVERIESVLRPIVPGEFSNRKEEQK